VTSVVEPANKIQTILFTHTQQNATNFRLKIQSDIPQNLTRVAPLFVADGTWAPSTLISASLVYDVYITE